MTVGIDGLDPATAPKVHRAVEIYGNTFSGIKKRAVKAFGLRQLLLHDNHFDPVTDQLLELNGKPLEVS